MHFLLIYPSAGVLGGIETLLGRMASWLSRNGHQVTLLLHRAENWTNVLPKEARCVVLGERFRELYYFYHAKRLWRSLGIPSPDVIKSFDLSSSWMACQLAASMPKKCKVIAGIYNPFVFKWYYSNRVMPAWDDNRLYLQNYLKAIPANARLFCGVDQIEELQEVHGQSGMLWALPIDMAQFERANRKPQWGKLVSIGRLSSMKEYNLYMIDVVHELRSKGYKVTWSVFGTGEYEQEMRNRIAQRGLEKVISMGGSVAYSRFGQALEDCYIFIGMGTSLMEAALFKVPNVAAAAYDRIGITCGPIYNHAKGSIGPSSSAPLDLKVSGELERILCMTAHEYEMESERVYNHVRGHEVGSSMGTFLDMVNHAGMYVRTPLMYLANYPLWCFRRLMTVRRLRNEVVHPPAPVFSVADRQSFKVC